MLDAPLLIEVAAKSLVLAGATLGALRLTRKRSAAERSLIGHLGLVSLIVLPTASLMVPGWNPLPVSAQTAAPAFYLPAAAAPAAAGVTPAVNAVAAPAAAWAMPSASDLTVWFYFLPLVVLLSTMVVAVVRLGAMHRRASVLVNPSWQAALAMAQRRMGFKHGTALLVSEELRSPVSWGVMRPIILLNEQAVGAVGEAEAIIAHELAHVARLDWAKLLISRVACALFWFNPLVWRLARECHQLREEAADDAVLLSEVDGADYASLLVNAARHDNKALLIAAHGVAPGKDSLKRRITRVLDADLARGPANNAWAALCLVSLVAVAAPLAAFDPTVQTKPKTFAAAQADGTTLVTTRDGNGVVTIKHFPDGHETLISSALEKTGFADEADRAKDKDDEIEAIIGSKAVGLTPEYIAAMRAAGFTDADVDDLTGARAVGVTPEFARQMRQFDRDVDLDTVIGAKATGLSAGYYSQMRQMFPGLTLDDAVGMSAVGVTPGFAQQMRQLFPRISADDIQGMAAVGVTPEYVREMRRQGLPANDPDQAIESRVLFSPKHALRVPTAPVAPAAPHIAGAVAAAVSIGLDGLVARGADGSRVSVSRAGLSARGADGSSVAIGAPPGDRDKN
uniref:M56 family metallopeptidase n=1 Tax=Altererythrobacter segetis TaxID=1104773 RepID=UPI00140E4B19|nr:M56 family metallopeptidase [Altererythrobacter segetis]